MKVKEIAIMFGLKICKSFSALLWPMSMVLLFILAVVPKGLSQTPTIFVDDSSVSDFNADVGSSQTQSYTVHIDNFLPDEPLVIDVGNTSGTFTVSLDGSTFSSRLEIQTNPFGDWESFPIWIKYTPPDPGPHTATISHSASGATTQYLSVNGNPVAMPVRFRSFTGSSAKDHVLLEWSTTSELNNSHFEIEVMEDVDNGFEKVGRVNSKVLNSKQTTSYAFRYYWRDEAAGPFYFRLKQVDLDGGFTYSRIISVDPPEAKITIAPNPFTCSSPLNITTAEAGKLHVAVLNMSGKEVYRASFELKGNKNSIELPVNDQMPAGTYILVTEFKGSYNRLKLIKS